MWGCEAVGLRGCKDVRLWGCKLWGCEVVRLRGFQAVRLTGCDFALWGCDVWSCEVGRLSGCETMRLWDCETMIWDYETMIWYTIEAMRLWTFRGGGGVAFSLIPSFTFPSFKNSQITLGNLHGQQLEGIWLHRGRKGWRLKERCLWEGKGLV